MTRDELIETMARAICIESGYEPDSADHETLPDNESIDGWRNWFGFKSESMAALTAIETAGLAIVPVEATNAMICAGVSERHIRRVPFAWNKATVSVYRAMIEAGRI